MKIRNVDVKVQKGAFDDVPLEEFAQFLQQHGLQLTIGTEDSLVVEKRPEVRATGTLSVSNHLNGEFSEKAQRSEARPYKE